MPRLLYDQMMDPHIHPNNAHLVEIDYNPLGGWGSRESFVEEFMSTPNPEAPGEMDWNWPPHDCAVNGSQVSRPVGPGDADLVIDRIGGTAASIFRRSMRLSANARCPLIDSTSAAPPTE